MSSPAPPLSAHSWEQRINADISLIVRAGLGIIGGFILIFGLWGGLLPLSGAVVSSGVIAPIGKSKALAHPTGGTVIALNVRDGETIAAGTSVLTLDPVVDKAALDRLQARRLVLLSIAARLTSERSGARDISFPDELMNATLGLRGLDTDRRKIQLIQDQQLEFDSRRLRNDAELKSYRRQITALEQEGLGLKARQQSLKKQAVSLGKELALLKPAADEGYVARRIVTAMEREEANISGEIGTTRARMNSNLQRIFEIEHKISKLQAEVKEKSASELTRIRGELADNANQIRAARRIVNMKEIRAPVAGTVVRLAAHALGGTIKPGETIAEIVPSGSGVVAEVRIAPQDIDNVHIGQSADISITAFNQRLIDSIAGTVSYISADSIRDAKTGETYFLARLSISDPADILSRAADIHAGMQVNAFIQTKGRVFFSYLLSPIVDSFRRAFRES